MLDRYRAANWWVGRITDPELGEWTGMAPRAVIIVLGLPYLRAGITGGGRGRRITRRLSAQTRNAVGIIQALNEAGATFELAANIIGATPFLASTITPIIDYTDNRAGVRSLMRVDANGPWLATDIVPAEVWERHVLPCRDVSNPNPGPGDILEMDPAMFVPNTARGTMILDRSGMGLRDLEVVPMTEGPVYRGEKDPLSFYAPGVDLPTAAAQFDDHLLIVNGRWVFHRTPNPSPVDNMDGFMSGYIKDMRPEISIEYELISRIEDDRKTVRPIGANEQETEQKKAEYYLRNADSLLDVNMTLAVRKMKRRALGLAVASP